MTTTVSSPRAASRLTIEGAARTKRELTFEEYWNTPETRRRYEIENGVVIMSPAAVSEHQWLVTVLMIHLTEYVRANKLGFILTAPLDLLIRKTPKLQTRQPDLLYISKARSGYRTAKELTADPLLAVAPDLVIEILSPRERKRRLPGKLADYAILGVLEVWVLDKEAKTVEVFWLDSGNYLLHGLFRLGDTVLSRVLPGLTLTVQTIFETEE